MKTKKILQKGEFQDKTIAELGAILSRLPADRQNVLTSTLFDEKKQPPPGMSYGAISDIENKVNLLNGHVRCNPFSGRTPGAQQSTASLRLSPGDNHE